MYSFSVLAPTRFGWTAQTDSEGNDNTPLAKIWQRDKNIITGN